jgi:hypothetical protein
MIQKVAILDTRPELFGCQLRHPSKICPWCNFLENEYVRWSKSHCFFLQAFRHLTEGISPCHVWQNDHRILFFHDCCRLPGSRGAALSGSHRVHEGASPVVTNLGLSPRIFACMRHADAAWGAAKRTRFCTFTGMAWWILFSPFSAEKSECCSRCWWLNDVRFRLATAAGNHRPESKAGRILLFNQIS